MLHAASLELRACLAAVLGAEDEVLAGYRLHAKAEAGVGKRASCDVPPRVVSIRKDQPSTDGRQLGRQALGMAARADLREEAVRLAQLSLAPLLVAALACELGELDVDQRLQ